MAARAGYDAVVLDIMLPGIDGFEACRRLRAAGVWTPVLMLTARDAVSDRVDRPRRRRRRLPGEAVRVGGAARPDARARRRRRARAAERARRRRPAPRPRHPHGHRGDGRDRAVAQESRCSRRSCAAPGEVLPRAASARAAWDWATRPVERRRRLRRGVCARRSTRRSGGGRSKRSAARATGWAGPSATRDEPAEPRARRGRVCRGDDARAAGTGWFLSSASRGTRTPSTASSSCARSISSRRRPRPRAGLTRRGGRARYVEKGEAYAQLLDASGAVVDATAPLTTAVVLPPADLRAARRGTRVRKRPRAAGPGRAVPAAGDPVVHGDRGRPRGRRHARGPRRDARPPA